MTVELIGLIAIALGLASLFYSSELIIYMFIASSLLGAAGALTLDFLGGTNVQPAHLLLGFLAIKLLSDQDVVRATQRGLAIGRPGFWLLATTLYVLVSAYLLPRLFAGDTLVFPVRAQGYKVALAPTTSNLTQPVYFVGNCICFLLLYGFASRYSNWRHLLNSALMVVILNLVFVVLDLATYWTGTSELLSFIRNASYALLSDTETEGLKRIVGSFTEASAFGYATLGYFAFSVTLWLFGVATRLTLPLALLSLTALLLSTSTTAYVGLTVLLAVLYLQTASRWLIRPLTNQMFVFVAGAPILLIIFGAAIALNETTFLYVQGLVDHLILQKMSTDSGIERSSWNTQAIQNFFDTFGFGVGNGSARASSFPLAVIASLGLPGALLYSAFLLSIWFGDRGHGTGYTLEGAVQRAARAACLAWLIAASISGALIDLGLSFFAFAALACARPQHNALPDTSEARVQPLRLGATAG